LGLFLGYILFGVKNFLVGIKPQLFDFETTPLCVVAVSKDSEGKCIVILALRLLRINSGRNHIIMLIKASQELFANLKDF